MKKLWWEKLERPQIAYFVLPIFLDFDFSSIPKTVGFLRDANYQRAREQLWAITQGYSEDFRP